MKRGHVLLMSGAALLAAGITISALWGVSFAGSFLQENTVVAKTTLDATKSVEARTDVNQLDKPLTLAIGIDKSGQQPYPIRLRETVTDPSGKVVSTNEFADSFFTSLKPEATGVYTVTVTNLGTKPVTISGAFGHMPFIGTNGKPDINVMAGGQGLGMIIVGGGLAAAGVLVLIIGGVITAVDGRTKSQNTATAGQGGVTYRKD
jgi:hypothetical protein